MKFRKTLKILLGKDGGLYIKGEAHNTHVPSFYFFPFLFVCCLLHFPFIFNRNFSFLFSFFLFIFSKLSFSFFLFNLFMSFSLFLSTFFFYIFNTNVNFLVNYFLSHLSFFFCILIYLSPLLFVHI